MHPDYNTDTLDSDIGVVDLPTAASLNNEVDIACLPTGSASEVTTNCYISGELRKRSAKAYNQD